MFARYAIFYTPPPGPFADFCASWLGWDSALGQVVAHPDLPGLDVAAITATPRKYGFHGTLKAPFRLAKGAGLDDLQAATAGLAQGLQPVFLDKMSLQNLDGFLALMPAGDLVKMAKLTTLSAEIVRALDPFRAPLSEAELAKRRQVPLTPRQDAYLTQWGYPYVMEDFRFHLTLSGRLTAEAGASIAQALGPLMTPLIPVPFPVDGVTLVGQDEAGMFHEIQRYALTG